MRDLQELRRTLAEHAELAPDGAGVVEAAQRGAVRIRRRRRVGYSAGIALVLAAILAVAPVVTRLGHGGSSDVAGPPWHRDLLQVSLGLDPRVGNPPQTFGVYAPGIQYMYVDLANNPAQGAATVAVYDPGTYDSSRLRRGERVRVNDHAAYYVPDLPFGTRRLVTATGTRLEQVIGQAVGWQDGSGAWVVVFTVVALDFVPDVEDLLIVTARAVRLGQPRDLRAPVRLGYVPAGLPPAFARITSSDDNPDAVLGFGEPAQDPVPNELRPSDLPLEVRTSRLDASVTQALGKPTTIAGHDTWYLTTPQGSQGLEFVPSGSMLVVTAGTCMAQITTTDRTRISYEELKRMVEAATFADCTNPRTWIPLPSG